MSANDLDLDSNEKFNSLEALFGADLDDIADLPAFEAPAPGAYILGLTMASKKVNDKPAVEAKWTVQETVELKNSDEGSEGYRAPSKPGTQFSTLYTLNKYGIASLKATLLPFAEVAGSTKIENIINFLKDELVISATITNKADKEDPEKIYARVGNITVA